jgi:hypothetical protein
VKTYIVTEDQLWGIWEGDIAYDRGRMGEFIDALPVYDATTYDEAFARMTAAATAHRGCCGSEHDPSIGKLHGYCVVCGVPWPCETAQAFLFTPQPPRRR